MLAPIPKNLKASLIADPSYKICSLSLYHQCEGRITWEHAIYYRGARVQARFAIIPLCAKYHSVDQFQDNGLLDKERNRWCALNRATDEELRSYERAGFIEERERLNRKLGEYRPPKVCQQ